MLQYVEIPTDEEIANAVNMLFPFAVANPGQKEAIFLACQAIFQGIPHVIIEAPTGTGKSVIATTIHNVIHAFDPKFRTSISTATKNLQMQYQHTPKADIYDLMGKTNYSCPIGCGPYNSPKCRSTVGQKKCIPKNACPYITRRLRWTMSAQLRSTNNSFMIEACTEIICTDDTRSDLTVLDECHKLEDHLLDHTTVKITEAEMYSISNMFADLEILQKTRDYIDSLAEYEVGTVIKVQGHFRNTLMALSSAMSEAHQRLKVMVERAKANGSDAGQLIYEAISELQGIEDKAKLFTDTESSCVILQEREVNGQGVTIKPVFAADVSEFGMFRKGDYHVHMSATICGTKEYARSLGIAEGDYKEIQIDNPIPLENRPVHVVPVVKMTGGQDDFKIAELVKHIDNIIDSHAGQNGIVHTVSYKLAEAIYAKSRHKKNMLVSGKVKDIMEALVTNKGRVILSPSIEEGVDLKGDLSRFQILAKVPYGYLGDPLVKLRSERYPSSYARTAILRIVQACGRSVRGIDDSADTYILDSSFEQLLTRNSDLFPVWFKEALHFHEV